MISFLKELFFKHWPRKLVALIAASFIFYFMNQSLTTTKTVNNISVRVVNIPLGKTVDNLGPNNLLNRKISLTITGKKTALEELSGSDLEVQIDAAGKTQGFSATIVEKNLFSNNPDFNINKEVRKVAKREIYIQIVNLASDKIPIYLLKPTGEAPKGYQYLDIRPHIAYVEVTGPEDVIKKLKTQGLVKIYNMNDITSEELDGVASRSKQQDVISYHIPEDQRYVYIPSLSQEKKYYFETTKSPIVIDFLRTSIIPIDVRIPLSIYIPTKHPNTINPQKLQFETNNFVALYKGVYIISNKLYAKGVSQLFIETVQSMMRVVVVPVYSSGQTPTWSLDFINYRELEERYVAKMLMDTSSQQRLQDQPEIVRKDFYRSRFRHYMNQMLLVNEDGSPLDLNIEVKNDNIVLTNEKPA